MYINSCYVSHKRVASCQAQENPHVKVTLKALISMGDKLKSSDCALATWFAVREVLVKADSRLVNRMLGT